MKDKGKEGIKTPKSIEEEIDVFAPVGKIRKTEELFKGLSKSTEDIKQKIKIYYDGRQHTLRLPAVISNDLELKDELETSYDATITLDRSGNKPRIIVEVEGL